MSFGLFAAAHFAMVVAHIVEDMVFQSSSFITAQMLFSIFDLLLVGFDFLRHTEETILKIQIPPGIYPTFESQLLADMDPFVSFEMVWDVVLAVDGVTKGKDGALIPVRTKESDTFIIDRRLFVGVINDLHRSL